MKKLFTLISMFVLAAVTAIAQQVYTEFVEATGTLTYYYDTKMSSRSGITEVYDLVGNPDAVRFVDYNDKVLKAVIDPSMKEAPLTSMSQMFGGYPNYYGGLWIYRPLRNLKAIEGLENLNTANVTNMGTMFFGCESLTSLDLSTFDTKNVTRMTDMFFGCESLTSLDLSTFDTKNVTRMGAMFSGCESLTSLNLSSFNTANVKDMALMFSGCESLTSLNLSSFNTANVEDMDGMFNCCKSLKSLDLSSFNTANVRGMRSMFENCSNLTTIFCNNNWCTSQLLKYSLSKDMFTNCTALVGGKGTKYDHFYTDAWLARPDGGTSKPGYFTEKGVILEPEVYTEFVEATGTLTFYYDNQKSSRSGSTMLYNQKDGIRISQNGNVLKAVIDPSMKEAPLTSTCRMFNRLNSMTSIQGLENLNTTNVTNMTYMFQGCSALTSLDFSSFNTSSVTDMTSMFQGCSALKSLDLSSFNTARVMDMSSMFYGCSSLTSLDLISFNTTKVTNMQCMFDGCKSLTSLDLSSFNTANVTDMSFMFNRCKSLKSLDLRMFNTAKVAEMNGMFQGCSALTSLDLSPFNTANVTDMREMFYGCSHLTSLDLSSFNVAKVIIMNDMFRECSALTTILCSDDWSTLSAMFYSSYMFENCTALVGGKGTKYDSKVTDVTYARPDGGTDAPGYFTADTMTRINSLTPALSKGEGAIYNLSGQRVNKPVQKGLYIINGKKMMVK